MRRIRYRLIVDDFGTLRRYKLCPRCRGWLALETFPPRRDRLKDGLVSVRPQSLCRPCDKARCLANQARWRQDPAKHQRIVETQRMNYRIRQARKGRAVRPLTAEQYEARYGKSTTVRYAMPAEVLAAVAALVDEEVERGAELEEIAARAGIPSRRLWAIRHGHGSLPTLDRVCIALGVHLIEIGA